MKIRLDQRGIAHIGLVIIVLVVAAAIGAAAWKVSSNKSSGGGSGTVVNKAAEESCLKETGEKDLCKFASRYNPNASYSAVVTSTTSEGTSKSTIETDGKDNSSMVVTQDGKEVMASISLNGDSYIKDLESGTWIKYAANKDTATETTPPTEEVDFNANDITEKNTITYKNLGKEACGKLTCFYFQVIDSTQKGTTQYLWFDTKDYQMQRWYFKDAESTSDMVFTYKSVKISAPSPVKDSSEASGTSQADVEAAIQAAQEASAASESDY